jgi:hypothetical protein
MISLTAATGLIDAITAGGGDPDAVLSSLGLTRQAVSNPMGVIPSSDFTRLLEAAAQATHDVCFGLHFAEHYQPKNIGPLTYVVLLIHREAFSIIRACCEPRRLDRQQPSDDGLPAQRRRLLARRGPVERGILRPAAGVSPSAGAHYSLFPSRRKGPAAGRSRLFPHCRRAGRRREQRRRELAHCVA